MARTTNQAESETGDLLAKVACRRRLADELSTPTLFKK
jgi:hypothetical protein